MLFDQNSGGFQPNFQNMGNFGGSGFEMPANGETALETRSFDINEDYKLVFLIAPESMREAYKKLFTYTEDCVILYYRGVLVKRAIAAFDMALPDEERFTNIVELVRYEVEQAGFRDTWSFFPKQK